VRAVLDHNAVPFNYVDIRHDPFARGIVRSLNRGHDSVPTLVFPDGSVLTEPNMNRLCEKLLDLGYHAARPAWISAFEKILIKIASQRSDNAG
jgi:mycoredoxin